MALLYLDDLINGLEANIEEKEVNFSDRAQTTNTVLMIPPHKNAGWNEICLTDNTFMTKIEYSSEQFQNEFYSLVNELKKNNINVILPSKEGTDNSPDCMFPNNWISFHNGNVCIYAMKNEYRRKEVRFDIISELKEKNKLLENNNKEDENNNNNNNNNNSLIYNFSNYVNDNLFLEGTGSLVLDRLNRIAFCGLSQRSCPELTVEWSNKLKYKLVLFDAKDPITNMSIYHTNVLMAVCKKFVVICLECITKPLSKKYVMDVIKNESKKDIIEISLSQMKSFCGNILELDNNILAMSDQSFNAFTKQQIDLFTNKYGLKIVHPNIKHIESIFGGGVRCMIAEIFTKK